MNAKNEFCGLGVEGLDDILNGGLPRNRMYLIQGEPGTGKTTLALQYLLEGVNRGETCLYITFSETKEELEATAKSHGWSLDRINLFELSSLEDKLRPESQTTIFHPSEVELNKTTGIITGEVERLRPSRVVFDSASEMRLMAETSLRYRRQLLALKQFFSGRKCTVLFLDDLTTPNEEFQIQSIVHGVIALEKLQPIYGVERRRIRIAKLRGVPFREGNHDCVIRTGGIAVFPRISSANQTRVNFTKGVTSSKVEGLDSLLGGGLDRGTSTLILGPAGTGKSTLTLQYAHAAAERGERVAIFSFEETVANTIDRSSALGLDFEKHIEDGRILFRKIDPAEISPGEFADTVRSLVLRQNVQMVVIDSLSGLIHAMPHENHLILQLHELLNFLNLRGVVTLIVLAQQGIMGTNMQTPVDLTYLADTVVITRFFEAAGSVKTALSVIKKRTGPHEKTIRELQISSGGVVVGQPLVEFQGVLTGVPRFHGSPSSMLKEKSQKPKINKRNDRRRLKRT